MNPLAYQLRQIKRLLSALEIDYAIIGGIAVSVYSEPRLTLDIDINVMLDSDKINQFLKNAKRDGFSPIPPNVKKFIKRTGVIPMKFSKNRIVGKCDFIIAQNVLEHLSIKRAHFKKIYSVDIKVASPEDLIIHKLASERPRDIEDALGILISQRNRLDISYITSWIKKIADSNRKPELSSSWQSLLKIKI